MSWHFSLQQFLRGELSLRFLEIILTAMFLRGELSLRFLEIILTAMFLIKNTTRDDTLC